MGRDSLLKSTNKKPAETNTDATEEAKRRQAILEGMQDFPVSIKQGLEKIGLSQSTYYRWSKKYKTEGIEGLKTGAPVSDDVWKRFVGLKKEYDQPKKVKEKDRKQKVEETQKMKSEKDSEKVKKLLFKKFDEGGTDSGMESARAGSDSKSDDSVSTSDVVPPTGEPMDKTMKIAIGGFAVVLAILLISSFSNTTNFYFTEAEQGVELWQGRFAPMGENKVATITGSDIVRQLPKQETYSKKQAYGVVFDYLVQQADDVLKSSRTPDLKAVKSYLLDATKYAVTSADRKAVRARLNSIDFLVISGKADLALNKGTMAGFEAAKSYLTEAIPYATTDIQKELITKRLAAIEYAMASNKISKGEKQLAQLYREALDLHLRRAKQYSPEKSKEIDEEITKIKKWLDEFDRRHIARIK